MIIYPYLTLHPVNAGEIPEAFVTEWDDYNLLDLDLDAFTGSATWAIDGATPTTRSVAITENDLTLQWQVADHAVPGLMRGVLVVTAPGYVLKQPFKRVVRRAIV